MENKKFKLKGIGLDTTTIIEKPVSGVFPSPSYIFTSIDANNDYLLGDYIKSIKGYSLIVKVNFIDSLEDILERHLKELGVDKINLLVLPENIDWSGAIDIIKELRDNKIIEKFGIYQPGSLDTVKSISEILDKSGEKLEFVTQNISPLEFNHDIVNYCEESGITVIGFNPVGGYLSAPRNIDAFSLPYLLGFAASNADVVILSGRNLYESWKSSEYLKKLIGKDSSPKYINRKNVSRGVKSIKRLIGTSIKLGDNIIIPYKEDNFLMDPGDLEITLGDPIFEYSVLENIDNSDKMIKEVKEYMKVVHFPDGGTDSDNMAIARYKLTDYLDLEYPKDDGWNYGFLRLGNTVMAVSVWKDPIPKKWFWKSSYPGERHSFFLSMPEGTKNIIFTREKDNSEND